LREVVKVKARLITWDDQNGIQCGKVFESSNGFKSVCNNKSTRPALLSMMRGYKCFGLITETYL
jgi:hypothetical protein